jgi:hypothetical protein
LTNADRQRRREQAMARVAEEKLQMLRRSREPLMPSDAGQLG